MNKSKEITNKFYRDFSLRVDYTYPDLETAANALCMFLSAMGVHVAFSNNREMFTGGFGKNHEVTVLWEKDGVKLTSYRNLITNNVFFYLKVKQQSILEINSKNLKYFKSLMVATLYYLYKVRYYKNLSNLTIPATMLNSVVTQNSDKIILGIAFEILSRTFIFVNNGERKTFNFGVLYKYNEYLDGLNKNQLQNLIAFVGNGLLGIYLQNFGLMDTFNKSII